MTLILRNTAGIPIYEQIKQQVKAAIYDGSLQEGASLPSIRQLAKDLNISVITTTRAYNDLEQEGFLASVPGKGFFVLPRDGELLREQSLRQVEEHLSQALAHARRGGLTWAELLELLSHIKKEEGYETYFGD